MDNRIAMLAPDYNSEAYCTLTLAAKEDVGLFEYCGSCSRGFRPYEAPHLTTSRLADILVWVYTTFCYLVLSHYSETGSISVFLMQQRPTRDEKSDPAAS